MSEQLALVAPAVLTIDVEGIPVAQGSMIAVPRGNRAQVVPDNASTLRPWRKKIAGRVAAACALAKWMPIDGPVSVTIDFWFARPKSEPKRARPHVKPDIDKCARAVLDELSGPVVIDDSRVVTLVARKHYGIERTGCRIVVTEVMDR